MTLETPDALQALEAPHINEDGALARAGEWVCGCGHQVAWVHAPSFPWAVKDLLTNAWQFRKRVLAVIRRHTLRCGRAA